MKFTGSSALLAGAALLSAMSAVSAEGIAQASVKPLQVKKGGIVTVTVNFVVDNYDYTTRRLQTEDPLQAGLSTDPTHNFCFDSFEGKFFKNDTKDGKDKTDKFAEDDEITIKSARVFPNTWKPKESADIDIDDFGTTALFELPEEGLVQDKEYKITYKVRIGKGVESGIINLPVAFAGPGFGFEEPLKVLVK